MFKLRCKRIFEIELRNEIVLRFMADAGMRTGDGAPVDAIVNYGFDRGFGLDEMEAILITSVNCGWISVTGNNIHLTRLGYLLISPANDNG